MPDQGRCKEETYQQGLVGGAVEMEDPTRVPSSANDLRVDEWVYLEDATGQLNLVSIMRISGTGRKLVDVGPYGLAPSV